MISEGSCDTEDWSNDAQNLALLSGHFKIWIECTLKWHNWLVNSV